jgi:hypothetical protein
MERPYKRGLLFVFFALFTIFLFACVASGGDEFEPGPATKGVIKGSAAVGMGPAGEACFVNFAISTPWLDTGIDIKKGDLVSISSVPSEGDPPCDGAVGCPPYRDPDDVIEGGFAGDDLKALVGRVGDDKMVFSIGRGTEFIATGDGRLFIGYNDCEGCFGDNTGVFETTITVEGR